MSRKEISKIILILKTSYPYAFKDMSKDEVESMVSLYEQHFKEYGYEILSKAIYNITSVDEYMPTIARIKKEIAKLTTPSIPRAEDEWNRVIALVHKYGSYNMNDALNEMNEYTRYIVNVVGYLRICYAESEEQIWNKKEFVEEYNTLQDKNIEMIQIGNTNYMKKLLETEVIE